MRDITDVIKEYEQNDTLSLSGNDDVFKEYLFSLRIFLKNDVCELIEIEDFDFYNRIIEFNNFITYKGK